METADEIVRAELDADPLDRGYSSMTDAEVSADLNMCIRESWVPVLASDILEIVTPAALADLDVDARRDVDSVLSMGSEIDFGPGTRARTLLTVAFAGSPPTLNALKDLGKVMICRARELGCAVNTAIVTAARAMPG
jgi:hypothetical protein